jgi:hypothetical protein
VTDSEIHQIESNPVNPGSGPIDSDMPIVLIRWSPAVAIGPE